MYKIAVLGPYDSIYGFATLGLDIFPTDNPEDGKARLRRLAADKYAVVYVTEGLAASMQQEIDKYKEQLLPAIILIPGITGNTGEGVRGVKTSVEKAVGSDIIFGE
ncbi:MAG: V-type ATP synthase subunit F [Lachnospiraceae bacterium]|nr:V-type ATP synthase subunit F [Lachnospiraceae bacterium]MCD8366344.1 V-type ATP synthase subunit F [Clostridiales bacterium]